MDRNGVVVPTLLLSLTIAGCVDMESRTDPTAPSIAEAAKAVINGPGSLDPAFSERVLDRIAAHEGGVEAL